MAIRPTPGRSLVSRRALLDIVRTATLGSYGVTSLAGGSIDHLLDRLGLSHVGIDVRWEDGLEIDLDLIVALGVPVAEVARQVDSAIRHAVRRAFDREVLRLIIHIDGLHVPSGAALPDVPAALPVGVRPGDLADSGTDVA